MTEFVELTAAPPPAPFYCPPAIDAAAWPAFAGLVADAGPAVYQLPTSCELLLRQHLAAFPKERQLLALAVRHNVPADVARDAGGPHAERLEALSEAFARATGTPQAEATWAVNAWATALGRSPDWTAPPPPRARRVRPPAFDRTSERVILGGVAGLGGAVGAAVGNGGVLLALHAAYGYVDVAYGVKPNTSAGFIIILLITAALGAFFGFAGAFAGWWLGRGDERPWSAAAAACGAAFGTGCVSMMCTGPGLISGVLMGLSAMGACYTAASRGGHTT